MKKTGIRLILLSFLLVFIFLPRTQAVKGVSVSYIVNSTADGGDLVNDGICATSGGVCTLRAALEEASGEVNAQIQFDIPGVGPHTFLPATPLPVINTASIIGPDQSGDTIILDGTAMADPNPDNLLGLNIVNTSNAVVIKGLQIQNFDRSGILIAASNVTIGGSLPQDRNIIIDNQDFGIEINASGKSNITVTGNYIGVDASGIDAHPNGSGISVINASSSAALTIGDGNLISGNMSWGIIFNACTNSGSKVIGNRIGVKADGKSSLANSQGGILINKSSTFQIGGSLAGQANQIAGNTNYGIRITESDGITIQSNLMSTSADQTGFVKNTAVDIKAIDSGGVVIGGGSASLGNVLLQGISISGGSGHYIQHNRIGITLPGVTRTLYTGYGVELSGTQNTPVQFNAITHFDKGVLVSDPSSAGILISQNGIWDNAGLGIDLGGEGVTANDALDVDTGPNGKQNFPVFLSAELRKEVDGIYLDLAGTLSSKASTQYRIEIFSSARCHPSGNGEGQDYLTGLTVTTGGDGTIPWEVTGIPYLPRTEYIGLCFAATTTETTTNNTSEFSNHVRVGLPMFLPLIGK